MHVWDIGAVGGKKPKCLARIKPSDMIQSTEDEEASAEFKCIRFSSAQVSGSIVTLQ